MKKEEIIILLDKFIREKGLWQEFLKWAKAKGYTLEQLAFPE